MEVRNRLLTGNYCQIRYNNQQPIHKRENFHPLISNVNTRYTPQMFGVLPGKVNIAFKGTSMPTNEERLITLPKYTKLNNALETGKPETARSVITELLKNYRKDATKVLKLTLEKLIINNYPNLSINNKKEFIRIIINELEDRKFNTSDLLAKSTANTNSKIGQFAILTLQEKKNTDKKIKKYNNAVQNRDFLRITKYVNQLKLIKDDRINRAFKKTLWTAVNDRDRYLSEYIINIIKLREGDKSANTLIDVVNYFQSDKQALLLNKKPESEANANVFKLFIDSLADIKGEKVTYALRGIAISNIPDISSYAIKKLDERDGIFDRDALMYAASANNDFSITKDAIDRLNKKEGEYPAYLLRTTVNKIMGEESVITPEKLKTAKYALQVVRKKIVKEPEKFFGRIIASSIIKKAPEIADIAINELKERKGSDTKVAFIKSLNFAIKNDAPQIAKSLIDALIDKKGDKAIKAVESAASCNNPEIAKYAVIALKRIKI